MSPALDVREAEWAELAFDNVPLGMCVTGVDGIYLKVNSAFARTLGYDESELRGAHFLTITHPDDRDASRDMLRRLVFEGGRIDGLEKRYVRKNGDVIWADVSVFVSRDEKGEPACFIASLRETTERRREEEALRTSEYFFRESQRVASIGSYKVDFVTGLWESSEVLDQIFGIDSSFVRSISGWLDLVHPDDTSELGRYLRDEVIGARRPFDREYRIVRKSDGATRWVSGRGQVTVGADGAVVSMLGTIQDVTERKSAELSVRVRDEEHRAILRTAMDGFWLANTAGEILEANETYARMSGYSVAELQTMRVSDLEVNERPAQVLEHMANIIRSGRDRFESRHRRKDGTIFDVEVSVQHHVIGGERIVSFIRDITERRRAEEERAKLEVQLRQAQKMESVGRLAGGVAHDFNNMLGAILGYADMAIDALPPEEPVREDLLEIRKAAERSADLTRQLLAFARRQPVAPKVLDLNDAVAGLLRMLRRLIGETVNLSFIPEAHLWRVRMDPSQVDEILVNLCVNARDAVSSNGQILISTRNVEARSAVLAAQPRLPPGDYVALEVTDNGSAMDEHTLQHLFEPFFTTKAVGKGTGLGLATVYGAVRQNEGDIEVRSQVGVGTTFTIFLPRHTGPGAPAETAAGPATARRGHETILLVEDEPAILKLTATQLERSGYKVLAVARPADALLLAETSEVPIDLLVTDVVMPEMNGRELSIRLSALFPAMRCLFMSGYTAELIAHQGVIDEGIDFIQKPFTGRQMTSKIRALLDSAPAPRLQ